MKRRLTSLTPAGVPYFHCGLGPINYAAISAKILPGSVLEGKLSWWEKEADQVIWLCSSESDLLVGLPLGILEPQHTGLWGILCPSLLCRFKQFCLRDLVQQNQARNFQWDLLNSKENGKINTDCIRNRNRPSDRKKTIVLGQQTYS